MKGTKNELQEGLTELENALYEALEKAKELHSISKEYRCFGGQLKLYLIENLEAFIENSNQCGSVVVLQNMLDNNEDGYEEDEEDE